MGLAVTPEGVEHGEVLFVVPVVKHDGQDEDVRDARQPSLQLRATETASTSETWRDTERHKETERDRDFARKKLSPRLRSAPPAPRAVGASPSVGLVERLRPKSLRFDRSAPYLMVRSSLT
jgi:hypothetical protein